MKIFKDKQSKRKNNLTKTSKMTFSKKCVSIILTFSIIWISLSYVLAFLDKPDIAQELSKDIVVVIIATMLSYFLKSFFETKEEESNKIVKEQLNLQDMYCDESSNDEYIDESL